MQNPFENIAPEVNFDANVVAIEVGRQMIARLDWMKLQPKVIVDIGCGVATSSDELKKRYPNAEVFAIDAAVDFLRFSQQNQASGIHYLGADATRLPMKEYGIDLIFANLLLPWCEDLTKMLAEWRRLLKPGGLLMLTSFGPDTLKELPEKPLLHWLDMHNVGDALIHSGFLDPVLDVEYLTLHYQTAAKLVHELQVTGFGEVKNTGQLLSLTYEIIYGHAFGAEIGFKADDSGEVRVPLSALRQYNRLMDA